MTSTVLAFSCPDRPGIVAQVASELYALDLTIVESQQFDDPTSGRFFSRIEFRAAEGEVDSALIGDRLAEVLAALEAQFTLRSSADRPRVLILASKQDHCLVDLLYRARSGDLPMEVVGVVSNHPRGVYGSIDLADIPFHYLPVEPGRRREQEQAIARVIADSRADLVVLARYMQILSDEFASELDGRCINIHHSFLPGFKGAKPYHQAYERGVKLIGATAHYVTGDLDEGPIIVQDVEPVSHRDLPDSLVRKGRDIERRVLARAVRFHLEDRVLRNGRTTVVFPD